MIANITRLAIRGYGDGELRFSERLNVAACEIDTRIQSAAERHTATLLEYGVHMIEIEFLDEKNPTERYFRFGTDPTMMVAPLPVTSQERRKSN